MEKLKRTDERESYRLYASVDQRIGHRAFTPSSAGSSPAGGTKERGVAVLVDGEWRNEDTGAKH